MSEEMKQGPGPDKPDLLTEDEAATVGGIRAYLRMTTNTRIPVADAEALLRIIDRIRRPVVAAGTHRHKCESCGFAWEHENSLASHRLMHTCRCGREQWEKYHGPDVTDCAGDEQP
jgi:hypothetical protein